MDTSEKRELAESAIIATVMFLVERGYIKIAQGKQAQDAALAAAGFEEADTSHDPFASLKGRIAEPAAKAIHFDVLGMTCAPELREGIEELVEYAVDYLIDSGHLRSVDAVGAKQVLRCKLLQGPPPTAC